MRRTRGSETSQYLEEEKSSEIPSVAASEGGRAQTDPTTKCIVNRQQAIVKAQSKRSVFYCLLLPTAYCLFTVL